MSTEDMTEAINTAREVLDLASPSGWGEKAAKADLSDTASALVEHHLSRSNDTAQKIASNLMSDKSLLEGIDTKGLTDSALGSLAESGLTRVFSTFASVGFGVASLGMGDVISFGSAAGNIINAHKQLIELFDKLPGEQRTNPGFAYKDVEIFGQKVEIWSDATSYPPVTYTNPDFSNSSDPGAQNNFINDHYFQSHQPPRTLRNSACRIIRRSKDRSQCGYT